VQLVANKYNKYNLASLLLGKCIILDFFFLVPLRPDPGSWPHFRGFAITFTGHTTCSRTPLDEWSARHRETLHSQETDIHAFGRTRTRNSSSQPPQAQALDSAASGIG